MRIFGYIKYFLLFFICVAFVSSNASADEGSFTVVIDAGHGGKDAGAIDNGIKEKDVNLAVAVKLAKLLKKKDKNLNVILTRDRDVYLTLQQRADIANRNKADFFISIHTNSVDLKNPNRKTIEGASTYTLGLHKDNDNMDVARRENAVMTYENDYDTKYSGFDPNSDESYIIFEMAQKANMAQSVKFAEAVQKQLVKTAGRKDRGVKQAGFWVLWATSMPSVLVELDFITNPKVAEFLGSDSGQNDFAKAICNATASYVNSWRAEKTNVRKVADVKPDEEPVRQIVAEGETVVLASSGTSGGERLSQGPADTANQNVAASRRRRNERSRVDSMNQDYEGEVVTAERNYVLSSAGDVDEMTEETEVAAVKSPQSAENDNDSNKKSEKKKESKKSSSKKGNTKTIRVVNGKNVVVASSSNPNDVLSDDSNTIINGNSIKEQVDLADNSSNDSSGKATYKSSQKSANSGFSPVRLEKKKIVYRIQILASEEHLNTDSPRFRGLSPVRCTKDGNLYKYTYGESSDSDEINQMLVAVREKIPDAFIVTLQN